MLRMRPQPTAYFKLASVDFEFEYVELASPDVRLAFPPPGRSDYPLVSASNYLLMAITKKTFSEKRP
jgi:hypothetical protein